MKNTLLILIFGLITFTAKAQDYESSVGLRGGFHRGVTYKHFLSEKTAFEGLLMSRYRGVNLTALLEFHNPVKEIEKLKWYYGFGGHIGYYNSSYYTYFSSNVKYNMIIGVDGILGLEYTLDAFPVNISLDWKPTFNLIGGYYFGGDSGALSVRYCFE